MTSHIENAESKVVTHWWTGAELTRGFAAIEAYFLSIPGWPLGRHPRWLTVLETGLGHRPGCLVALRGGEICGFMPLCEVRGPLFGRFLVSLPYLNGGGVWSQDPVAAAALMNHAERLTRDWPNALKFLELREDRIPPALATISPPDASSSATGWRQPDLGKVHMRRPLPKDPDALWKSLKDKVRNQVRTGQSKHPLSVSWGGANHLDAFHAIFSRVMRDLGTPVYPRSLFQAILTAFPNQAEICLVQLKDRPVAAALLLHGDGIAELPSAAALKEYHYVSANMFMYWNLFERAILRGQCRFDMGRCTKDGGVYRFKKQWGAVEEPLSWRYWVRSGAALAMRPDQPRYRTLITLWKRLPLPVANLVGPWIVRGIP